ncbi:hypothetical protein IGI04_005606, partial [Brassica rapa subsp. trilocularis]
SDRLVANQSFRETSEEIHKIFIIDIHFGNHYCHDYNTIMKGEEESSEAKLDSIDHEFCFNEKVNASFSPRVINYVKEIYSEYHFQFLRRCGWETRPQFSAPFTMLQLFERRQFC